MRVLSLFDGISCGQLALNRAGFKIDSYFASEIDKYAMAVTKYNYPKTIQVGDVTKLAANLTVFPDLLGEIDLLMAGSPCQGFSFAGKQLNFDDPRSKLFFDFVRILKAVKPKFFLLENVKMKKEYQDVITDLVGVEVIEINSALVSAQNRKRLYWTNIPNITQPEDKGIILRNILQKDSLVMARPCKLKSFNEKSICHHAATATGIKGNDSIKRIYADSGKSPTVTACQGGNTEPKVLVEGAAKRGRYNEDDVIEQRFEDNGMQKSNAITTVQKDSLVKIPINQSIIKEGKAYCITANYSGAVAWNNCERKQRTTVIQEPSEEKDPNVYNGARYRKLTPLECERLQTIEDNYTLVPWQNRMMSNFQRYKQLGNGWTIDVIVHILKGMRGL